MQQKTAVPVGQPKLLIYRDLSVQPFVIVVGVKLNVLSFLCLENKFQQLIKIRYKISSQSYEIWFTLTDEFNR